MSRTWRTSRIQREVIHAHGHSGSNQKSTRAGLVGAGHELSDRRVRCCQVGRTTGVQPAGGAVCSGIPATRSGAHVIGSAHPPRRRYQHEESRHGMAPPNLTRDRRRAAGRAAGGRPRTPSSSTSPTAPASPATRPFATTTTVRFPCREPGAGQLDRLRGAPRSRSRHAQRHARSTSPATARTTASRCPTWPPRTSSRSSADRPVHEHRRGPAPLRRPGRRRASTSTRSSRPPTPSACSPASTSPTSRPATRSRSPRRPTGRSSPTRRREVTERAGGAAVHRFATTEIMSHLPGRAGRGPVRGVARRVRRRRRHDPARHLLPRLARRAHGRRAAVHRDQAGLRLLPPQLRRAGTRSASTTSCSCPSSTRARWRTPAR